MSYLGTVGVTTLDILRPLKLHILHNSHSQGIKAIQEVAKAHSYFSRINRLYVNKTFGRSKVGEHKKKTSHLWVVLLFPPRFSTTTDQLNFLWQLMKLFASLQSILALSCYWNWREWQKAILACPFRRRSSLCQQSLMKGNGILPLRQLTLQVMSLYSIVFLWSLKIIFRSMSLTVKSLGGLWKQWISDREP